MPQHPLPATALTDLLGCRLPIVLAGMGGVARSELVAAVTRAGGYGFLGMVREPLALIEREVAAVRAATGLPFGVNIIPAATPAKQLAAQVDLLIALRVASVELFWEVDARVISRLRDAGVTVVHQVGSAREALAAQQAGAQALIAQGVEAGGHVRGRQRLQELLDEVLAVARVPVAACGGLADGRDLARALMQGAHGAVLGTAFMATEESFAHDAHKRRLVAARASDTVLTEDFHINWPPLAAVRVLRSSVTSGERGDPFGGQRTPIGDEEGRPIYLFSTDSPLRSMTGDFEAMALYAGRGVDRIDAIVPAAALVAQLEQDAARHLRLLADAAPPLASPVCYAPEAQAVQRAPLLAALDTLLRAASHRATVEGCDAALHTAGVVRRAIRTLDGKPWTPAGDGGAAPALDAAARAVHALLDGVEDAALRKELEQVVGPWLESGH